ncbi:hypothetical protein AKJ09_04999 [Labilithrix luteola]|uniref:Uncharacterized protein n=1 Tax=Labilithrix luteola TaxID=1391654 RepID=A0A0K1PXT5_9BACT|nr:hypothetical protein AKJ09_04999 [Labilithrix luteola]
MARKRKGVRESKRLRFLRRGQSLQSSADRRDVGFRQKPDSVPSGNPSRAQLLGRDVATCNDGCDVEPFEQWCVLQDGSNACHPRRLAQRPPNRLPSPWPADRR